jgi:hypothetical protein
MDSVAVTLHVVAKLVERAGEFAFHHGNGIVPFCIIRDSAI